MTFPPPSSKNFPFFPPGFSSVQDVRSSSQVFFPKSFLALNVSCCTLCKSDLLKWRHQCELTEEKQLEVVKHSDWSEEFGSCACYIFTGCLAQRFSIWRPISLNSYISHKVTSFFLGIFRRDSNFGWLCQMWNLCYEWMKVT